MKNEITTEETKEFLLKATNHLVELFGYRENPIIKLWPRAMTALVNQAGVFESESYPDSKDDFLNFLSWAVNENTNELGGLDSVKYLAKAKDKMATLSNNFESLWRNYSADRKSERVKTKARAKSEPLPDNIAHWLMMGYGVNEPLGGWNSARDKLNSIKKMWYGNDNWQDTPDPNIDFEDLFQAHIENSN